MSLQVARVMWKPEGDLVEAWFAAVDDKDNWIGVSRKPEPEDEEEVRALFKGNGKSRPMTAAKRWIHQLQFYDKGNTVEFLGTMT